MGKVVIFSTGAKGGVGKSTLTILMIEALREAGIEVACIVADERSAITERKYLDSPITLVEADPFKLGYPEAMSSFRGIVNELKENWVVVDTSATWARIFDDSPEELARSDWETRAVWSLALIADRDTSGADDDGLFESIERGMLSAMVRENATVVRPMFQLSYRGQQFWYDKSAKLTENLGLKKIQIKRIPASLIQAIHRDRSSMTELIAKSNAKDPVTGANLQLIWHSTKVSLAETILAGANLRLGSR